MTTEVVNLQISSNAKAHGAVVAKNTSKYGSVHFNDLLANVLSVKSEIHTTVSNQGESPPETLNLTINNEELLILFNRLEGVLEHPAAFTAAEDLLSLGEIQTMLEGMPPELREKLSEILTSNVSFEDLLDNLKQSHSPEAAMGLMLLMYSMKTQHFIEVDKTSVNTMAKLVLSQTDGNTDKNAVNKVLTEILDQLIEPSVKDQPASKDTIPFLQNSEKPAFTLSYQNNGLNKGNVQEALKSLLQQPDNQQIVQQFEKAFSSIQMSEANLRDMLVKIEAVLKLSGPRLETAVEEIGKSLKLSHSDQKLLTSLLLPIITDMQVTNDKSGQASFAQVVNMMQASTKSNKLHFNKEVSTMETALSNEVEGESSNTVLRDINISRLLLNSTRTHHQGKRESTEAPVPISISHNILSQTQQLIMHTGQSSGTGKQGQQLVDQFLKTINKGKFMTLADGSKQMTIRLNPEHLGSLTVKLSQSNGEMIARIIASSSKAKEMLDANIIQLRTSPVTQGLAIDKIEVYTQEQFAQGNFNDEQNQNGQQKQHKNNETDNHQAVIDGDADIVSFEEVLLSVKV
ncbi:flagellar hook-length control protein FliK [Bacillus sp. HMF5848]|uniref:flagellar hook-length control protein FliK n=1 Tax=Bacillus sp. HMF5848 TaxID=2495421 RepID=UPI000F770B48|nr:flagellar hook-length control protein FliK [Bacillus sp. HMF5848]RSK27031.1 flagellar hook-length control protein FliK [Bacillus sp. HMF5848]